jgi:sulfonate transport system substrate-binding protein
MHDYHPPISATPVKEMALELRFGAHPSNLTLTALTHYAPLQQPLRDAGLTCRFLWYSAGAMMHDLAATGEVNVIGTGTTRAVVAQAAGFPIAYIGMSQPRDNWSAILVREDSDIRSVADLKGRRVGLIEGSFQTYFLLAALDREGLTYDSVERIDLPPAASRAALAGGEIDAWIAMNPYLAQARDGGGLRSVIGNNGLIANRSVFWVLREVAEAGQPVVQLIFDTLAATDHWIGEDPARAGALFAEVIGNGLSAADWAEGVRQRTWGISPPDAALVAEQQREADLLFRHGMQARQIDIRDALLPYEIRAWRAGA